MTIKQSHPTLSALVCLIAALLIAPSFGREQGYPAQKVKTSMQLLQSEAAKLGPVKIEGTDLVAGNQVPAIYFGTATIFVKNGNDYIRVATNVKKDDGSRAVGTILDPNGEVIVNIRDDKAFYGEATVLGKAYTTGYEPIRDSAGNVIGIYYVGYLKE